MSESEGEAAIEMMVKVPDKDFRVRSCHSILPAHELKGGATA